MKEEETHLVTAFLDKYFITIFLIVGFSVKLWSQRRTGDAQLRYFWLTLISVVLLIAADSLEDWASLDPDRRFWRLLFSVVGYAVRPTAALSIALIIYPLPPHARLIWLPNVLNALIYCTAFFSPLAFSFTETYNFNRGPLGYTAFVVSFFYIALAVWATCRRFKDRDHGQERFVLYVCAGACVASVAVDVASYGAHVNTAIMVSSVFLYMFLRAYDMNRDPLTKLLTRQAFYEDCARYASSISAVGSVDMNGLKTLNDTQGHEKGDEALKAIGSALDTLSSRNLLVYRIGGDEFALLFLRQEEPAVRDALERLKTLTEEAGYTVSAGYAMRHEGKETVKELLRLSDEQMYEEKAAFYRKNAPSGMRA